MNSKQARKQRRAQERVDTQAVQQLLQQLLQAQQQAPIEPPLATLESRMKKAFPRSWKTLAVGVMVGGFLFYVASVIADGFALSPQVSAQASALMDPRDPLSALITITNDNFYAIHEVEYECIQGEGTTKTGSQFEWNIASQKGTGIKKIVGGDSETISCAPVIYRNLGPPDSFTTTDFMIRLFFRPGLLPAFVPFRSEKIFRFVARTDKEGKTYVFPQAQILLSETVLSVNPFIN